MQELLQTHPHFQVPIALCYQFQPKRLPRLSYLRVDLSRPDFEKCFVHHLPGASDDPWKTWHWKSACHDDLNTVVELDSLDIDADGVRFGWNRQVQGKTSSISD